MAEPKRRALLSTDDIDHELTVLRSLRGQTRLSRDAAIIVLHVYYAWLKMVKNGEAPGPANTRRIIPLLTGVSRHAVELNDEHYESERATNSDVTNLIRTVSIPGNFNPKPSRVRHGNEMYCVIRDYIREKSCRKERVTAVQLLNYLVDENHISVKRTNQVVDKKDNENALRALRAYLRRTGFRRGKSTDHIRVNSNHELLRARYLRVLMENRPQPPELRRREVCLDESYIHHDHNSFDDSLWDPHDNEDVPQRMQHKGGRYCFASAFQGPSSRISSESVSSFVPQSQWIFSPTGKQAQGGDYYRNFNFENIRLWWTTRLLPKLAEPSITIMDNCRNEVHYVILDTH